MISNRANNIFDDLLSKLENQIKQTESEIQKEKESVLLGIECKMEEAVDKIEIASLDKQYEKAEKQFDHEGISQRRKTVADFVSELGILTKHIKKVYSKELNNK
jgi:hypothetical protein